MAPLYVHCGMEGCTRHAVAAVSGRLLFPVYGCTAHVLGWLNNIAPIVRVVTPQGVPESVAWR